MAIERESTHIARNRQFTLAIIQGLDKHPVPIGEKTGDGTVINQAHIKTKRAFISPQ